MNLLEEYDGGNSGRSPGCFDSIKKCSCILSGLKMTNLYSIAKEIEAIKNRINDLSGKRSLYGLKNVGNKEGKGNDLGRLKQLRRATSFAIEDSIVGFEDVAKTFLGKILEDDPRRRVISIFGMGGLGKTTLARRPYHNQC